MRFINIEISDSRLRGLPSNDLTPNRPKALAPTAAHLFTTREVWNGYMVIMLPSLYSAPYQAEDVSRFIPAGCTIGHLCIYLRKFGELSEYSWIKALPQYLTNATGLDLFFDDVSDVAKVTPHQLFLSK